MGVPWQQIAGSVNSLIGNAWGAWGSVRASDAEKDALRKAMQQQRAGFATNTLLQEPYRNVGYQALGDLAGVSGYSMPAYATAAQVQAQATPMKAKTVAKMLKRGMSLDEISQVGTLAEFGSKAVKRLMKAGLTMDDIVRLKQGSLATQTAPGTPQGGGEGGMDFTRFYDSPDYLFRRSEGNRGIEQSAAARGGALSGNALRALDQYNSNIAANEFNNWWNRRAALAGAGQLATNNVGDAATGFTNNMSDLRTQLGDARASGILGVSNAAMQHHRDLADIWGLGGGGGGGGGMMGGMGGGGGGMMGGMMGGGGYGSTPFGAGSWDALNAAGSSGALSGAGSWFSDRRLKRDIVRVGVTLGGTPVYEYEYVWGGGRRVGVMADEVPHAAFKVGDYYMVDYSKVL